MGFDLGVIVLVPSRRSAMQGTVLGYIGVDWSERAKSTQKSLKIMYKIHV